MVALVSIDTAEFSFFRAWKRGTKVTKYVSCFTYKGLGILEDFQNTMCGTRL